MRTTRHRSTICTVALLSIICLFGQAAVRADVMESARMLPDDTMFMVSVESVSGLRAACEKTSMYGLYKDPTMQQFVTETEKKVRELIDTTLKDLWQKMEIENPPEQFPYPEGRLVLGVSLFKETAVADANAEESKGDDVGVRFALLADMGSRVEQIKQIVQSLSAGAANAGSPVEKKQLGGIELNVLAAGEDSDRPTLYYGLKDSWLLVMGDTSKETAFTESIMRRMGRSVPGALADKAGFKSAVKTLGDAQVFVFVNTDAIKSLAAGVAQNKAQVDQMIKALGFENVTGITMAVQVAGQKNQEMTSKALIGIDGPKTGIPALLSDASAPLKMNNRLLSRDAVGFVSANYSPVKIFDGIAKIVQNVAFMDLNMMVQAGMAATAGEGGQPPVQLRDDVLAQMAGPVFVTWQMDKPYKFDGPTKFLVGLSVQDAGRLNGAIGRIHQAFLGPMPEMRREMLDQTVYLLPSDGPSADSEDGNSPGVQAASKEQGMAFSVAGDSLVFGRVGEVEQAIRSQQKEPQDSLASDPMFRYAEESLPAQACVYVYQNDRLSTEASWTALKQMARDASNASGQGDASWNPMMMGIQKIKAYVDLSKLPDFKAVEKYWGASVGYMQSRPEGLYWESIALRPPQQ